MQYAVDGDERSPTRDSSLAEAFQWFLDCGDRGVLAVSAELLMVDARAAPLLRAFSHQELWRWAHDQSQAVVGWQPLPFPDGRSSRLLWISTTSTGAIAGTVFGMGEPRSGHGSSPGRREAQEKLYEIFPGTSALAQTIRDKLSYLLQGRPSLRIRGGTGVGKDFVARRFVERYSVLHSMPHMDPLVLRGDQVLGNPVWLSRLEDAVDQGRPVLFHDLDRIPEHRLHRIMPALAKARERKVPVVATESLQTGEFAERMWARVFRDLVELPSLQARREDVEAVAQSIWKIRLGRMDGPQMSAEAARLLSSAEWRGNVAELEAALMDAWERCDGSRIEAWALRIPVSGSSANLRGLGYAEYGAIVEELRRCGGNKKVAASMLGISRSTLYRKMRLYGITTSD